MAKLFANLDRLKDSPMPNIASTAQPINYDAQPQRVKSEFANNISLVDRLSQPNLRTTNHLPEFFLSDTYTGFLKIKPFGVFEHTSNIKITTPSATNEQGGTDPTLPTLTTLTRQGVIVSNNVYKSIIDPKQPVGKIVTRQGVVESNQIQKSVIELGTPVATVDQGGIVIQQLTTTPNQGTIEITKLNPIINQGADTSAKPIPPIQSVGSLQGILLTGTSGIVVVPTKGENGYLTLVNSVDLKKIKITSGKALEQREFSKIAAIPSLQILVYVADRAIARATPTVKHGTTLDLRQPTTNVEQYDPAEALGSQTPTLAIVNGVKQFEPTGPTKDIITELGDVFTSEENVVTFDRGRELPKPPTGYARINKNKQLENPSNWVLTSYKAGELVEDVIDSYSALARRIYDKKNNQTHYNGNDTVVKIARVGEGGKVVTFTAFITSLSDTTSPAYQDNQYIGRQDITKTFKGVTRQISLGFKAVALGKESGAAWSVSDDFGTSKQNALELVRKVNKLQQIAGIGTVQADQAYTLGPTLAITVAGLYSNVICTANSIKVDVPIADTPWETGPKPLPMYYDISMDFSVLTANGGSVFNSDQNFIGY